jgi:AcrR family transcriptional regulator
VVPARTSGLPETATGTVRRRPGGRSARVRTSVLSATTEILAERGYDALSYEEVAERADVHRTTLYRWWPTKADLVLDATLTQAGSVVQMRDTGDLEADVLAFLRAVARNVTSPLGRALLIATARSHGDTATDELRRRFWDERFRLASARLEDAKSSGQVPSDADPAVLIEALISPIHFRALITGAPITDRFLRSVITAVGIARSVKPALRA